MRHSFSFAAMRGNLDSRIADCRGYRSYADVRTYPASAVIRRILNRFNNLRQVGDPALLAGGRGPVSLEQVASSELCGHAADLPSPGSLLGAADVVRYRRDVIWRITQGEIKRGNRPATVNRYLSVIRNLLRTARDEWQWIDRVPKVRLLGGEVERDRWLTQEEADRLIAACPPHLAALVRFALATGCRARRITGLEWDRVDLERATAWLDRTKGELPVWQPSVRSRHTNPVLVASRDRSMTLKP
jgi:hypothetical protein